MAAKVQVRALLKAAAIAGGRKALAEQLGVKPADLDKWLTGKGQVPREPFLRAVEIILAELDEDADDTDPGDPPPPRVSAAWSPRDRD